MTDSKSHNIPLVFSSMPDLTEPVKIERTLSEPNCLVHVYEVHSPINHANLVVKVFPKNKFGTTHYEKEKLIANLNHPNIIHYVPTINDSSNPLALVTEFAENGTFLDTLLSNLLNHEVLVRTYFHQLIEGLEYLHSKGIAHLDLKLENLVIGSDFKLKIIDFDQAQMLTDSVITAGGTLGYRAPELKNGTAKDFTAIDVYSAGIILFTLCCRKMPFVDNEDQNEEDPNCPCSYSYFLTHNHKFWALRAKNHGKKMLSNPEFIELMNGMLCSDPKKRLRIEQIKKSKWYNGLVLDHEALKSEMKSRLKALNKGH